RHDLVADIEFLRALHRDFDVRARGLNTLDRVVLGEQTGCEQVEADNQDAGTRPSKQSHDESLPSLELNSGAREPTIGNRPQLCSRTQRQFQVSDLRSATSTPPLAVLSKREPQWASRVAEKPRSDNPFRTTVLGESVAYVAKWVSDLSDPGF